MCVGVCDICEIWLCIDEEECADDSVFSAFGNEAAESDCASTLLLSGGISYRRNSLKTQTNARLVQQVVTAAREAPKLAARPVASLEAVFAALEQSNGRLGVTQLEVGLQKLGICVTRRQLEAFIGAISEDGAQVSDNHNDVTKRHL